MSEIQRMDDDIFHKIKFDRMINDKCRLRFFQFLKGNFDSLNEWLNDSFLFEDFELLWNWAWMNLCTRCFGHHHLPNDIAMCPLIDLVNHASD